MRTLLTVKRISHDGRVLDLRQGYSRSFLKHFIEALYLSHAHILTGTPLVVADVMGSLTRSVDGDSSNYTTPNNYSKVNLQVAGPSGRGVVLMSDGSGDVGAKSVVFPFAKMPGHVIGIMIGRDNTAVTPTDARLVDRVHHGRGASIAPGGGIDSVLAGDTIDGKYDTATGLLGMIYQPLRSCLMSSIQFKMFRTGNPGNVTCNVVGIYQANASQLFDDTTVMATSNVVNGNLWGAASPGAWVTFTFAAPVLLQAGLTYYIYITPSRVDAANYVLWREIATSWGRWTRATAATTVLGSVLTISTTRQPIFDLYGSAGAEMEYGATDIYGYSVVNPNASFAMRRIFMNNSGEAITVVESGIHVPLTRYITSLSAYDANAFVLCAARDVFAGINVLNGESIEVTYTPSITV